MMDYILHKASGGTAELNKQVGGFSAISSVLVKLNHNKVGEMELKLSAPAYTIAIGDWVEAKGKRFYCLNNWKEYIPGEFSLTLLTVEGFGLTSNFYHCTEGFDVVYSWTRDNNKVDTGSLKTFGEFFCYNVNYQQNTRLFKLGTYPEGADTDYRVLSFTNENALSCLYEICAAYGVRYEFVLNEDEDSLYILNFHAEDVVYPVPFSYEKQGGLYELNISNADGQVYTEFVVLGSDENLPADYPHNELRLSDDYPLSMIKYPDKYTTWGRSVKELKLEVKPSRVGIVTSEVAGDLNSFIDSDLIGATWSPVGGTIHVVEGPLLGFEFNVSGFNAITGKVTIEQNTEGATTLPEAEYYKFTKGTKYTITGIPLPASYLTTAQANLLTESEPHRLYWSEPRYDARINVKPKFLETNGEIEVGMLLPIVHEAIGLNRNFRVQSITYDPRREQYYDVVEIAVSDFRQESIADSQHKAIRTALHRLDDADKVSTSIKTSVRNLDTYIDGAFYDGVISKAEADAIEKYINIVNSQKSDIDAQFTALYANSYLSGTAKTNLNSAKEALNTATTNLLSSINTAIADGAATTEEKSDVDSKFATFNSALSTYQTRVEQAQEAISAAMKILAENAAKSYAEAQDLLRKTEAEAYADGKATDAEDAAIAAAEAKVNAAKVAMEAYADGVVSDEEAARIADANAKYEAALNYADSLAENMDADTTAKVTAAKNALAAKWGYADWDAMAAATSLPSPLTNSSGLIKATVIDATALAALDAFIEALTVIKLETAVDEDGTKVRIDADAVDGRAGVLLEESTGNRGIKLYYKASNGAPIFYLYSTDTSEFLEFLANRMKFSKGTTRDVTIDSANSSLQLRNGTKYAHISPNELRVDDLPDEPVGTGKFWVDTSTGIVHWGIVTPPSVTYSFAVDVSYPSGRSDIAASGGVATFTVKLITTTDGTPDAGVLVDLDTGYPSVASSPAGTNFSITRTGTGTYSITAASRGTVESVSTAAVISVKYTPSGATQQSTSFNILQEANSKTKTDEDTGITLSISTIYDDTDCAASGDTWTVTASGESGGREEYTYTSGAVQWVSLGGTPITASDIAITTSGTGLSGSGTGAGTSVTWADRGTTTGDRRSGTITASYSGESVSETVYQQYNAIESVTDKTINWVKLDGTNGNIEVDADAGYTLVTVELGFTNHYTSGSTYSGTSGIGQTLSVTGTGFSKFSNGRVDYTENTAQSTRNGVVTITYGDATPVQRTITQAAASATTYQILGEIAYASGSQIAASGGTATLTVTKQTYINGVHQSASDVLVDCDSGYPDLTSQPTGCDVSITRTGVGTYSLSAKSRGVVVNAGTDIEIDLQATIGGSAKTDSVTLVQQANALASSTNYQITSVTLDGVNNNISITKAAQTITVLGSGTYTKTYTSGSSESATFNLGTGDISVSGTGFSYSNFTISAGANSGAERTCTVTASYTGASNVTRTITQAMGIVAPTLYLDGYSLSGSIITLKASISYTGGGTISARGFECGNTSALGTDVSASTVQSGQFTADFLVYPGQTIYWRAYATNEAGTAYTTITNTTIPV